MQKEIVADVALAGKGFERSEEFSVSKKITTGTKEQKHEKKMGA